MAKRSTSSDRIIIDPLFTIPEGAEDQFSTSINEIDEISLESDEFEFYGDENLQDGYEEGDEHENETGALDTPDGYTIVSQTLRRAPGGQQVVDLVIEVNDVAGATNYEVQVTKA